MALGEAPEGAEYVITRCRDAGVNLRTQLERIITKAGLKPWPKLFQNLRSTRETELAETFPIHVVCAWIGNSRAVAQKHYLQVTDDHFAQARGSAKPAAVGAAQIAAQYPAESSLPEQEAVGSTNEKGPETPGHSERYSLVHNDLVGGKGLEPLT